MTLKNLYVMKQMFDIYLRCPSLGSIYMLSLEIIMKSLGTTTTIASISSSTTTTRSSCTTCSSIILLKLHFLRLLPRQVGEPQRVPLTLLHQLVVHATLEVLLGQDAAVGSVAVLSKLHTLEVAVHILGAFPQMVQGERPSFRRCGRPASEISAYTVSTTNNQSNANKDFHLPGEPLAIFGV